MISSGYQPLSFVEATTLYKKNDNKIKYSATICMSGTVDPLLPFIKGEISRRGLYPLIKTIPFGTLNHHINVDLKNYLEGENEFWILFPWDVIPSLDWRMGGKTIVTTLDSLIEEALTNVNKIVKKSPNRLVYVDAKIPPIGVNSTYSEIIKNFLKFKMSEAGAKIINNQAFSLSKYLATGFPLEGSFVSTVAFHLFDNLVNRAEPKKVLITDLDNTFWAGVAAEDGPSGIKMAPEGEGYKHFIFQSYLAQLQSLGVVVAAVSRNSENIIEEIFQSTTPLFSRDLFSAVIASYESKSAQIAELSRVMNLGLDSFVFVDDNLVEIEEVTKAVPQVSCVLFPNDVSELPLILERLGILFDRKVVTSEDFSRTEKYKLMLAGVKATKSKSHDIGEFLKSLGMKLHIINRTSNDWARAFQLINKTNQFNANGIRLDDRDFVKILSEGGMVYTARLVDKNGDHGEIVSCLIDSSSTIISFVMSCRVFQRTVEHAFLNWLIFESGIKDLKIHVRKTDRNEPFVRFFSDLGIIVPDGDADLSFDSIGLIEKIRLAVSFVDVLTHE